MPGIHYHPFEEDSKFIASFASDRFSQPGLKNPSDSFLESHSNVIEQRQEMREETIIVQSKVIEEGTR